MSEKKRCESRCPSCTDLQCAKYAHDPSEQHIFDGIAWMEGDVAPTSDREMRRTILEWNEAYVAVVSARDRGLYASAEVSRLHTASEALQALARSMARNKR